MVVAFAIVGYFIGTRSAAPPLTETPPAASSSPEAIPGQTYLDWRTRRTGPNARVRSNLDDLRNALPSPSARVTRTPEQHRAALDERAQRRAYDGSPPVVPHAIDEQSSAACLSCHRTGLVVEGKVARAISHPVYGSCTQCHVTSEPNFEGTPAPFNDFAGHFEDREAERAWEGAPPVIPHSVWMRSNCDSCHGVAGPPGLRTSHPERRSCTQCHAAPADESPPWAHR